MDYKKMMGYSKPKKKVIKEKSKPKKTVLDKVKQELNEWNYQPPTTKRWSSSYGNSLSEFEKKGGKDIVKREKLTESVESQVKGLWKQTILPAFSEDFTFSDKKNADKAIKTLKKLVSQLKVNDFWIGE